jgi:diadenosine tetraphosphate (Ap4A) HIT family hydrolase
MTTPAPCPFCFPAEDRIAFEDRLTRALWDAFPVSEGHLLIVPRKHVPTWFDATAEERAALSAGIDRGRDLTASRHSPDGFNIGINVGEAAGQTVFHLHVHLIPRFEPDRPRVEDDPIRCDLCRADCLEIGANRPSGAVAPAQQVQVAGRPVRAVRPETKEHGPRGLHAIASR